VRSGCWTKSIGKLPFVVEKHARIFHKQAMDCVRRQPSLRRPRRPRSVPPKCPLHLNVNGRHRESRAGDPSRSALADTRLLAQAVETRALRGEWPEDMDLTDAPALVRELAERGLWLEQESVVLDPRLHAALEDQED
jgi:hypothetical protein